VNWRRFANRAHEDDELRQELESFIEITAEQYVAQGMDPDEAQRAARRKLGNPTRIREDVYEMNTAIFVENAMRDLRHSVRMLHRNPAFAVTAILTLALGIGATTAIFSVVNGVLIKPLAYPEPEAVVRVGHSALFGTTRTNNFPFSPQWFATYAENNRTFKEFGLWSSGVAALTGLGNPEQVNTLHVTQGFLPALGVQPAFGRWFSTADDRPGAPETVILSSGYWQRRFGGDRGVVGRVITLDSRSREVIGVMPARFSFSGYFQGPSADLILPLQLNLVQPPPDFGYAALARLKPGVTLAQANADVARMLPIFKDKYAGTRMDSLRLLPAVRQLKEDVVGDVGSVLWVLLGGIAIVLLIACANVANLLLVRAEGRGQEFAVRTALGAGWGHLSRALIVESLTLGLAGALIGIGLAYGAVQILLAHGPQNLPRLNEIAIDLPVLAFAAATSVVSGLLFGLVPIARLARPTFALKLSEFLRGAGRSSANRNQHRSQNALVVVQVALALVLLVGSGLMIRTFQNLRSVKPGFTDPATVQTLRITIPAQVSEPERVTRMQGDILQRLAAIPGVTSAAFVTNVPMDPGMSAICPVEGKDYGENFRKLLPIPRMIKLISPGLFQTTGTPLVAGRDLNWVEIYEQRNVTLVSESLAREEWGSAAAAIGKRMHVGIIGPWQEVVGVAADVHDEGADKKSSAIVYWPAREQQFMTGPTVPRSVAFVLRSGRTSTESFIRDIRQAVSAVNSDLPLSQVRPLREVYDQSMARTSITLVMLGIAGAMALLLGIVGIYGVLAYAVVQRQREVGIRLALGAEPRTVKRMFVYRGMMLSGVGIALGAAAAAGLTRSMAALLFGVTPVDGATFAAAAGVLVIAALAASYIPARRAAAVDPVETLRGE
jgi:putative ABC transport system permease protein